MTRPAVVAADHAAYDPAGVDLWQHDGGGLFETVEIMKSQSERLTDIEERADAAQQNDLNEAVALLGEMLDIMLRPVGHRRRASRIIVDRYNANRLSFARLMNLIEEITVAGRPT